MDIPGFWIVDFKGLIATVFVAKISKVSLERKNIVCKAQAEFLDVFFVSFSFYKFAPGLE